MKNKFAILLSLVFCSTFFSACSLVDVGNVGIKINKAGKQRGAESIPTVSGYVFYNPITESVLEYPTYIQTAKWENVPERNEQLTFNSKESLTIAGDVSISFHLVASKVPQFYVSFRTDNLDSFTHGFLRNVARDKVNDAAAKYMTEELLGPKTEQFIVEAKAAMNKDLASIGVVIDQFGFIKALRAPESVTNAINNKIAALQLAIQTENELRITEANAKKNAAQAKGVADAMIATADGQASSKLKLADANSRANKLLAASLSPELLKWRELDIQQQMIEKWNGVRPSVEGSSAGLLMQLPASK